MAKNKKKIFIVTSIIAVAVLASATLAYTRAHADSPAPTVASVAATKPSLIFDDEFSGSSLDNTKWNTCYDSYSAQYAGCTNHGNFESEWYQKSQVSVKDGNLVLTAQKKDTQGADSNGQPQRYAYTSGMVATGRYLKQAPAKWTMAYGYVEARINVPSGQGIWPAFWLLPVDHQWPPEIDVMEVLGNNPSQALTTYHWRNTDGNTTAQDSSTYQSPTSLAGSWHTYAADWKPGEIDWYIDGQVVKRFPNSAVTSKPMQLILDLAVGGTLPGNPDATTPATARMYVDYVRAYADK